MCERPMPGIKGILCAYFQPIMHAFLLAPLYHPYPLKDLIKQVLRRGGLGA